MGEMKFPIVAVVLTVLLVAIKTTTTSPITSGNRLPATIKLKQLLGAREPNPASTSEPVPRTTVLNTIEQRVDNFDPQNLATYQQYYYMNGENFTPGGPLFVFLAGEWAITPYRLSNSLMHEMAREHNGYMFYLEHRYYGQSHPTPNVTYENLRWLTPEQAMADAAHFLEHIKRHDTFPGTANSPVILIGGHYSASLAIWMRKRYPHLVDFVWASSAPLVSHINHMEYKQLAGQTYRELGSELCYDRLEEGFAQMEQMVADGQLQELADMFAICQPFEHPKDVAIFFSLAAEIYSVYIQFSEVIPISVICNYLEDTTTHPSAAYAVASVFRDGVGEECGDFSYEWFLDEVQATEWDSEMVQTSFRQIVYQMCMTFGWFHTSDAENQPFGSSFPVSTFTQMCQDVFGVEQGNLAVNSNRFNVEFGGLHPNVTNVLFTQGSVDPWRSLGVMENLHDTAQAIVIEGASQANDLGPIHDYDSAALVAAKEEIMEIVRGWLGVDNGATTDEPSETTLSNN